MVGEPGRVALRKYMGRWLWIADTFIEQVPAGADL